MFTPPTRGERISWAVFYAGTVVAGVFIVVVPPITMDAPFGDWLTVLWGLMLATAIIPGVTTFRADGFKWEYATLPLLIAGVAIYAAKVWYQTLHLPSKGAKAALLTVLVVGLGRRWLDRRARFLQDKAHQQHTDPTVAG